MDADELYDDHEYNKGPQHSSRWSWRCFFGIHHWPKWNEPALTTAASGESLAVQRRSCTNCNRMQSRAICIQETFQ